MPYGSSQQQQPGAQGFQPPYPIGSPPPQSHTPSNLNQHQPPPSQVPDGYPSYPAQAPVRRQSHPSEPYPGYPPQQPTIQPPNISQMHLHDDPAKDYSPSNYSMDDSLHRIPSAPQGPPQSQPSYPPPMPQSQAPSQPPTQPGYPPSQPPASYYDQTSGPMSPPPPSHGPPPIPQGGPPDPGHRPITPLAQSSAYPTFSPVQSHAPPQQQYQTYNQAPTSYYR